MYTITSKDQQILKKLNHLFKIKLIKLTSNKLTEITFNSEQNIIEELLTLKQTGLLETVHYTEYKQTTGELIFKGRYNYSGIPTTVYECIDCKTLYPEIPSYKRQIAKIDNVQITKDKVAMCNGSFVSKCPWCSLNG